MAAGREWATPLRRKITVPMDLGDRAMGVEASGIGPPIPLLVPTADHSTQAASISLAEDTTRRASVEAGTRPRASALVAAVIVQAALEATLVVACSVVMVVEAIRAAAVILVAVISVGATLVVAVVIRAVTDTRTRLITHQEDRV